MKTTTTEHSINSQFINTTSQLTPRRGHPLRSGKQAELRAMMGEVFDFIDREGLYLWDELLSCMADEQASRDPKATPVAELEENVAALTSELLGAENKIEELEAEVIDLETASCDECDAKDDSIAELEEEVLDLKSQIDELKLQLAELVGSQS